MEKEQTLFGSCVILDQLLFGAWHTATGHSYSQQNNFKLILSVPKAYQRNEGPKSMFLSTSLSLFRHPVYFRIWPRLFLSHHLLYQHPPNIPPTP